MRRDPLPDIDYHGFESFLPSPMKPSDILPLLKCPVCSNTLSAPITLHCGHSLCSSHPFPDKCPISGCSSAQPALPRIPTHSTVHITTLPNSLPLPPPSIFPIHHSKVDVTINNIISIVSRTQNLLDHIQPHHDNDTRDPSDRPRKRPRRMSQDSCLLTHLQNQAHHSRTVPADQPLPSSESLDAPILQRFHKDLLTELTCEICFILLYQPITTPCQHVRLSSHLISPTLILKKKKRPFVQNASIALLITATPVPCVVIHNLTIHISASIHLIKPFIPSVCPSTCYRLQSSQSRPVLKAFSPAYIERGEIVQQEERDARLDTPIFVCQLSFPGIPTFLHFFEPK
jgi:hypothetical protein